jgi:PAS domain S-box-containing protein
VVALPGSSQALEKATVQLKWLHHFQFAGYYAAVEKGFYRQAGLDVALAEGGPATDVEDEVLSGRADFGVGTSALLLQRAKGHDLVVLGQIFQHSPAVFLTPRKSGIRSIADMAGRRFMYSNQHGDMLALLMKNGVQEKSILKLPHQGDPRDLIEGKADVMLAYSFNEPFILEQAGEPYLTFSPTTYGVDFYGDNFFATRELIDARPEFVEAFRQATLRGWKYAMEHKEETARIIVKRYSKGKSLDWLLYEANQMEALIQPTLIELGYQSPSRWQHIAGVFEDLGMLPENFDTSGIIYAPKQGQNYRLLVGTILVSCFIIIVLAAVVLSFIRLNRSLRAEITDRKHAEDAFRESEKRLRIIFETSQAGIIMVDSGGIVTFANSRMAEMFGSSLEEVIGSEYTSHLHPQQNALGCELMRQLIAGETSCVNTERRYLRRDGSDFWGYISGRRLETDEGGLRALVGFITDISDLKSAEEARVKALVFSEALLSQSPMAILVYDGGTGGCVRANQAASDIIGGSIEALQRQNFREILSWRANGLAALGAQVLEDGVARTLEAELNSSFGRHFTGRFHLSRFFVEGKPHLLVINHDITEEKRLDTENKRIEAQMLNLAKLESLGVLAGGIAHDFNNILTSIMGNISFGQMLLEPEHKARTPLQKAVKASHRAAELASQLLTFSKGGQPIKRAFSVKSLAAESLSLVLRGTNVKGLLDIPDTVIQADEGQISQAFNNLIINAVHAMPGGGTLVIKGEPLNPEEKKRLGLQGEEYIRLSFTDEGCGITEENLKKIFDPYFTTKSNGTGLGLASTHSIVMRHGGLILASSTVGKGSTFTVYLPSTLTTPAPAPSQAELVPAASCGGSVLVMDDEEMIRDLTSAMLTQLGYEVKTCADGGEAVSRYRAALEAGAPFSAVIMDLTIPGGMGGKEAAGMILALDPEARLIVSSGYSNDPVMAQYADFGFSATLLKPYTVSDIAQALASQLHRDKSSVHRLS